MSDLDRTRWDERYREGRPDASTNPEPFLMERANSLPDRGRALDVAGGAGRNAVWLAGRGLEVTVADISADALRLAEAAAGLAGLVIETIPIDLEVEPFPPGPWDLIVCVAYLQRSLIAAVARELAPDGLLVVVHPTVRNLERFARPGARFLLAEGELIRLLTGWEIVHQAEGWQAGPTGKHTARCLARRPRFPGGQGVE